MAQLCIDPKRSCRAETFLWAGVEPMGDGVQLALSAARRVGPIRQVLPEQASLEFICPALPGTVVIGKEGTDGWAFG